MQAYRADRGRRMATSCSARNALTIAGRGTSYGTGPARTFGTRTITDSSEEKSTKGFIWMSL